MIDVEWSEVPPDPRPPTVRDAVGLVAALVGAQHHGDAVGAEAATDACTWTELEMALRFACDALAGQLERHGPGVPVWLTAVATVDDEDGS